MMKGLLCLHTTVRYVSFSTFPSICIVLLRSYKLKDCGLNPSQANDRVSFENNKCFQTRLITNFIIKEVAIFAL